MIRIQEGQCKHSAVWAHSGPRGLALKSGAEQRPIFTAVCASEHGTAHPGNPAGLLVHELDCVEIRIEILFPDPSVATIRCPENYAAFTDDPPLLGIGKSDGM
jgi:hypothetical protein